MNFYVHHGQLEGMTTPKSTAFALSLIGATTSFVSGFFAPLVRVLEANWGFRRTILLGICLVSGGLIASGWAHQVSTFTENRKLTLTTHLRGFTRYGISICHKVFVLASVMLSSFW